MLCVNACSRLLQCTVRVSYSVYGCFTGKPKGALLLETVQDCVEQSGMEVVKHCSKRRRGAAPPPCSCLQPLIPPFPRIPPPLHFMPAPTTSKTKKNLPFPTPPRKKGFSYQIKAKKIQTDVGALILKWCMIPTIDQVFSNPLPFPTSNSI